MADSQGGLTPLQLFREWAPQLPRLFQRVDHLEAHLEQHGKADEPERYCRINIKQNAKGEYQGETTISLTMRGSTGEFSRELLNLHKIARAELYGEIEERKSTDHAARGEK